ncbi:MAG: hypothetical protein ABI543_07640 [Ignavibacteria bacterium]
MKKIFLLLSFVFVNLILHGCGQDPAKDLSVEISIATLNDNVVKYAIDIRTGQIDTSRKKVIAGISTGIKVPIDIEVNRENKLFVLNQGSGSIEPQVTIFSDTADGNIAPEAIINVNTGTDFKPIGLALAEGTDFIFVSYFPVAGTHLPKIVRFSISSGDRKTFEINSTSLGDIELLTSGTTIFALDPLGKQILLLGINSSFEIAPGSVSIKGGSTGLNNPSSIALTTDGSIHLFDIPVGTDAGRILVFDANSSGDAAPVRVLWSYCTGKTLLTPYGLAVTEFLEAKVILACSGNNLTTFPSGSNGCADFMQRIDIGAPVAVAFDKVRF